MKLVPIVLGSAAASNGSESRGDDDEETVVGAWKSTHTLPFPPNSFRELLSFAEGGVMHETNSFLYTSSDLDFSMYGLPNIINASDGVGVWTRGKGGVEVTFRKLLFDGSRRNFGDLLVKGTVRASRTALTANWHIQVVDLSDAVLADFGAATSEGSRIG